MRVIARTDVGKTRPTNQDALILGDGFCGVADGMGGHNGGETASRETAEMICEELADKEPNELRLIHAVHLANARLYEMQQQDETLSGMGTTVTLMWESQYEVIIGHVGDSRCYLFREDKLEQLTQDHSMVGEMIRNGLLDKEKARTHPYRNVITRAVGSAPALEVDTRFVTKQAGDLFLICSDGLCGYVEDEEIAQVLRRNKPEAAADKLIALALKAGGKDNVTLTLARITEEEA